jgi:hypothetical protein
MRNRFSARRLIAVAGVAAGLAVGGGVAYAAGGDPSPQQQDYVTIVDEPTPSPGTQGDNGKDCPEKDGTGQGQGQGQQNSGDTAQEQA